MDACAVAVLYLSFKQNKKLYIKNLGLPLKAMLAQVIFTDILCISIGLKLISNIDNAVVYNTTGAHAVEARGGTFRCALEDGLANQNTLDQLTNLSPLHISEGGAS